MTLVTPGGDGSSYRVQEDAMLAWLRCTFRGHHAPVRQMMGGFRCADCGRVGLDLEEMGFENLGYAPALRRAVARHDTFTS